MKTSKNSLRIIAAIMSLAMVLGSAIAFGSITAIAADAEQENEAASVPDIPVINRPYQTTDELGIDIEAIDALYPERIEARYENGRLYVDDNGYSEVSVNSNGYFDMELSDGVWSVELSDRSESYEFIYLYSRSDDNSMQWSVAYINGVRDSYVNILKQNVDYYISLSGALTITYSTENGLSVTDRYAKGVLEKHEVSVVVDSNANYNTVYKADGSVNYCDLYIYDQGKYYYLFPDLGWSSNWAYYTPCEAPSGYEHLDVAFFTEKMPSLLCTHEEWIEANCTSPKTCKSCGETEGEALGHDWESSDGVCSACGINIALGSVFANTVYNTVDEIGIQYKEIRSHFPEELEFKYENGKYMVKNIGASRAEAYTSADWEFVDCTLADGYWVYELDEEVYNDETVDVTVLLSGKFEGNEWSISYTNGKRGSNIQMTNEENSKYLVIYFDDDSCEFLYLVEDRSYRDMYTNGSLSQHTVEAYNGEDRFIINYDPDGSATYVHANLADGSWLYYFLEGGWATTPGVYIAENACDAPKGYEDADFEYFTSLCTKGIGCTHETYGAATCIDPERCTVCGREKEGSVALGHSIKEATCSSPAYCEICDNTFGESLEHDVVTDEAKAPTCTETGLTEGSHCSRCDGVFVEQEEIDALGHDWLDATNDAPKTCSVCGETEGEPLERATETETDVNGNETETDVNGDVSEQEKPDKGNTNNEKTEDGANGEGKSSGCGSSIGLGAVAIVMTVGAAVVVKKKED